LSEFIELCKIEISKEKPNKSILLPLLYGLAGTIQTTAAIRWRKHQLAKHAKPSFLAATPTVRDVPATIQLPKISRFSLP
jgi:hypothetical protein